MLSLAKWLKHQTICYEIDALQVMLPGALRAKYEKHVSWTGISTLTRTIKAILWENGKVNVIQFEKADLLKPLKRAIKDGHIIIDNEVKQKGNVKQVRKVQIHSREQLEKVQRNGKSTEAVLIEWMLENAVQSHYLMKFVKRSSDKWCIK